MQGCKKQPAIAHERVNNNAERVERVDEKKDEERGKVKRQRDSRSRVTKKGIK